MRFHSHSDPALETEFGAALLASLAPDGGLWMPSALPRLSEPELARIAAMDFADAAAELAARFAGESFSMAELRAICRDAYDFGVPLVTLEGARFDPVMTEPAADYILELFHGPTLAFKDFAARFMARGVSRLIGRAGGRRTVLVATSGDTGGAVGYAFRGQPGVRVVILYPEGGVSEVQERQLTTIGGNVRALRVRGTFDDCQALVKAAFADPGLVAAHDLMSANSINVGRVVPQSFYYMWTALRLAAGHPGRDIVYAVPSGNLGNVTGALMARLIGAPIARIVVGHNRNDPFVDYLRTGVYEPRDSVPTLSNAMDIGRPNNLARILSLLGDDPARVREVFWGVSVSDEETERHLRRVHSTTGYIMCPHTTVGHLAMEAYKAAHPGAVTAVTVATAHPAKFRASVERIIREEPPMPPALARILRRTPVVTDIPPELSALRAELRAESRDEPVRA